MLTTGVLSLAVAGCGSLGLRDDDTLITGSIKPQPVSLTVPVPHGAPPEGIAAADWAQAKLALDTALDSKETAPSIPWENRETGARGTATPVGGLKDNKCRDFRIGVVDAKGEHWAQGEACRDGKGGTTLSGVRLLGQA
ncbi:RT0821/Lpp0805 family surface protein [Azorhizobium oxalatiphilum]|nr:RT0821/Lpp0805 family surface protein [Azorhizobium oxalatiphilum]